MTDLFIRHGHSVPNCTITGTRSSLVVRGASVTILAFSALLGCGPNLADDAGESSGTETGGDDDTLPDIGESTCVEMSPGQVTCWVGWDFVWARVLLDCQVDDLVSASVLGPVHEEDLGAPWGLVPCYDVIGTDSTLCLWSSENIVLSLTMDGWVPQLSSVVDDFEPTMGPCDEAGDGDPSCDYLGCPCETGGCVDELVCDLSEHCSPCPAGSPGCGCDVDDYCEVGTCFKGVDSDGTEWSICDPEDPIQCAEGPCPGDAYCNDDGECAWESVIPCTGDPGGYCNFGLGCSLGDDCVNCTFVNGVYGCSCSLNGECEGSSMCIDGLCSDY